jgi:hypothetical protein
MIAQPCGKPLRVFEPYDEKKGIDGRLGRAVVPRRGRKVRTNIRVAHMLRRRCFAGVAPSIARIRQFPECYEIIIGVAEKFRAFAAINYFMFVDRPPAQFAGARINFDWSGLARVQRLSPLASFRASAAASRASRRILGARAAFARRPKLAISSLWRRGNRVMAAIRLAAAGRNAISR